MIAVIEGEGTTMATGRIVMATAALGTTTLGGRGRRAILSTVVVLVTIVTTATGDTRDVSIVTTAAPIATHRTG